MKQFMNIYMKGNWMDFQNLGISHVSMCRWKYTTSDPTIKTLWNLTLIVSNYWELPHCDILMEAIESIRGKPCRNLIKNPPSENPSKKQLHPESQNEKQLAV